jgi:hypothetical protein
VQSPIELAKDVLSENTKVRYGIFGLIESSAFFPPRDFLNEFLMVGHDPCDQDGRMERWNPFSLSPDDYLVFKQWWISNHPGTVEDSLGVSSWSDWVQEVFEA